MSAVQEAASLFGGPESTNDDPFASTLANTTDADTTPSAGSDPFAGQDQHSTSDLFGSSNGQDYGAYQEVGHDPSVANGTYTQSTYGNYAPGASYGTYDPSATTASTNGYNAYGGHAQGYGATGYQEGYSAYEPRQQESAAYGSYYNPSQYAPSQQTTLRSYELPATHSSTASSSSAYAPSTHVQTSSAYDPYAPAQPAANAMNVYDPYKPTQQLTTHPPAHPAEHTVPTTSSATAYGTYAPEVKSTSAALTPDVPPPLPSATAYRPKVSNAYDPPLPPPKPSRRVNTWQAQTSPQPQVPYGQPPQPVLSPPPPPRSAASLRQYTSPPPLDPYSHPVESLYGAGQSLQPGQTLSPTPLGQYDTHSANVPPNSHAPNSRWPSEPATGVQEYMRPSSHEQSVVSHPPNGGNAAEAYSAATVSDDQAAHDDWPFGDGEADPEASSGFKPHEPFAENPPPQGPAATTSRPNSVSPPPPARPASLSPPPPSQSPPHMIQASNGAPKHANGGPYGPPSRTQSPIRAKSPGSASIRSFTSAGMEVSNKSLNGLGSPSTQSQEKPAGPPPRSIYDPPIAAAVPRTQSPSAVSVKSLTSSYDPYAPVKAVEDPYASRDRSMSNASLLSTSSSARDPYAPSLHAHSRQHSVDESSYGLSFQGIPPAHSTSSLGSSQDIYGSQTLSVATRAPYAPSPSLLGTNDPLGRTSARVPVVSFGFGGRLVTVFHGSSLNTGFDVALSSRPNTDVHLRTLRDVIPESALEESSATFPGPLFSDPGTPTNSLIGTGAAAQMKAKKARVIKYLDDRSEELSQSIGFIQQSNVDSKRVEAKITLLKLLKVMVENDGKLSGSPQIDAAVRAALVPHISSTDIPTDGLKTAVSIGFPPLGSESHPSVNGLVGSAFGVPVADSNDSTISVHTLRSSHLDRLQELLVRGERRAAFQYAADEKLWAHAMVIASSIDKEAWKEVVSEFVRTELASPEAVRNALSPGAPAKPATSNGREPLRVAYSLFAGQGAASVQEFLPPKLLVNNVHTLQPPPPATLSVTPLTPSFPQPQAGVPIPEEVLSKWAETVAMLISSPLSTETSAALTALGDQLAANDWIDAAHACYLLSPLTSPFGGIGTPACRVHLFGTNPTSVPNFWKDSHAIALSEIVEFAQSLSPSVKGQEPFTGIPHLQAYRLVRAMALSELGHDQLANRYCEAISQSINRPSPYIHAIMVAQLKGLADRLVAAPHIDKSGSWIPTKMTKPSLDKLGNWLENRLTNFIAGDADSPIVEEKPGKDKPFSGPFAHYSTISTTPSTIPSPQRSVTDLTEIPPTPPYRTGSAMAYRSSAGNNVPINRASSAMDYIRRKPSPVPRVSSAGATAFPSPASFQPPSRSHLSVNGMSSTQEEGSLETPSGPQVSSWWGSDVTTPTATSFTTQQADTTAPASTDGFISLMDDPALSVTASPGPSALSRTVSQATTDLDDEEDDLGLGNSSRRAKTEKSESEEASASKPQEAAKPDPPKPAEQATENKQAQSGGWLSRLFGRSASTGSGPIKANLGDSTTFYYDKELKRWVNKNAGPEEQKSTPPPPPPRAQTASPGTSSARMPTGPSPGPPPPMRPATAIDLSESPPKKPPMRIRSNLVPGDAVSAPNTPASAVSPMNGPLSAGLNGPPRARPGAKRAPARSRYVDVFAQQQQS
ncbi:hypothetical protein K474DRAFT_1638790 [Panus rudis PR-1116 ss-1]|nr:hypothetical protein K474DRAFT_1638790 [Panus rudis PR-1116 ss-1]